MKFFFLLYYNFVEDFFHLIRIKIFLNSIKLNKPVIFDVGSHKGKLTKFFLNIYKDARVYCFEPNKKALDILKNIKNKKIIPYNFAVGRKNEEKFINFTDLDLTNSMIKLNEKSYYLKIKNFILKKNTTNKFKVKVISIDSFCKNKKIKKIDLLKIDTEGNEYDVLLGSKKIIQNVSYVMIEIQKNDMYKNYSIKKIEDFLKKNNFILIKKFNFPLMFFEDRFYKNVLDKNFD